jgi:hypothetical protein
MKPIECRECGLEFDADELIDGECENCRREECPTCEGTGYDPNSTDDDDDTCEDCGGDGVI